MGQKVHPNGARVGVIRDWSTRWYSGKKGFADLLVQDQKLREFLNKRLAMASVSRIDLERAAQRVTVKIHTAKPGIVIGRGGAGIELLKKEIVAFLEKDNRENHGKAEKVNVSVDIVEIKMPDVDAKLVAENIAQQLEKRISFRRAMKQSLSRAMKAGAKGIKTQVSGRLGGAEIARTEGYKDGSVPLQTLRANIDYGFTEAKTAYGRIGVKVWIYKGQVLPRPKKVQVQPAAAEGGK